MYIDNYSTKGSWKVQEQKLKSLLCSDKNPYLVDHRSGSQGRKIGSSKVEANIGIIRVQLYYYYYRYVSVLFLLYFFPLICVLYKNEKLSGNSLGTKNNIKNVYMAQFLFSKEKKCDSVYYCQRVLDYNNVNVFSYHYLFCPLRFLYCTIRDSVCAHIPCTYPIYFV
jgi:hypothetical protein